MNANPNILKFKYMWKNEVMADVTVDYAAKKIDVVNYTNENIYKPFGVREVPTITDFNNFLESRCFPKERRNSKQLLRDLGLIEYAPILIVEKTHGRMVEDYCWIKFEGEDLDYERDIKFRD